MRQIFILFMTFSLLQSCETIDQNFQKAYNQLPEIPLPLKIHTPNGEYFTPDLKPVSNDFILDKIGYKGYATLYGSLFKADNYKAILINLPTDVGTPMIFTFDKNGLKIDSVELFDTRPAITIGLISKETVIISPNGTIKFTDSSTYTDEYDKPYKTEIIKKTISLNKTGHFQIEVQ